MKSILAALVSAATLAAGIAPIYHLDAATSRTFDEYVSKFERETMATYVASGKLWMDDRPKLEAGKQLVEPRENMDVANGSIHHFSGSMHLNGATIEDVRRIMQDYANYPKYFKPDVSEGSGDVQPDSSAADEHFHSSLTFPQATLWISVTYDCVYDTHYVRLDPNRWYSKSTEISIKERIDPKDASAGHYPVGNDHGFLWRTHTYWFVRAKDGGIDLEVDSMTLSRPVPTGFGWWGTKRTHDAVDKMLRDMKAAIAMKRAS